VRRIALIAAVLLGASALAACQSRGVVSPTPQTVIGTVSTPTITFPIVPAFHLKGNPHRGKAIFLTTAGCGGCHTLADAGTTGTQGPNLDDLKPDYRTVTAQVTNGGGGMPSFNHTLSTQQIADVAAYVVTATGGTAP
jgi:mono/diheme cytochrome c family protein